MKKYFIVSDNESQLGVFEYTTNEEADSLIMQIICEHYIAENCELDKGFKIEEYQYRPLKFTGKYRDEDDESNDFEVYIEQVAVYSKQDKFDYVILTENNYWASTGKNATEKDLNDEIEIVKENYPDEEFVVVKSDKMEFINIS